MKARLDKLQRELQPDWPQRAIQFSLEAAQDDPEAFALWLDECRYHGCLIVRLRAIDADGYVWERGGGRRDTRRVDIGGHLFYRSGRAIWTERHYPDLTPEEVFYDQGSLVRFMAAEWTPQDSTEAGGTNAG